jgi:hypothetical protein
VDLAGPGLTLLTGPDNARWLVEADHLGLRVAVVPHGKWLAEVRLPADGALLLRPDAVIAWHSTSPTPLAEALTRLLGTTVALAV